MLLLSRNQRVFNILFWTAALRLILLHKGCDPTDLNNYCPFSKLSCLAKTLPSLVTASSETVSCVKKHITARFRSSHSTKVALCVLNNINKILDNRQHCAALFIDLSKALDSVDHGMLLEKLNWSNRVNSPLNVKLNYLSGRIQVVVSNCSYMLMLITLI